MDKDLLTMTELCDLLGIGEDTARKMFKAGLPRMPIYPGSRRFVVDKKDLETFLAQGKLSFDGIKI
jgi:excisionase family DNA binding protein